ncbi:MAG: hypothetical protein KH828_13760 [Clostridiales bacterium]|nr:hypothetical protein [Clostridiales bacterium]
MKKAIIVSVCTLILAVFIEVNLSVVWNMSGIGTIFAVAVMGGCILADINRKK